MKLEAPPLKLNLHFRPVKHRAVVITRRPLHERSQIPLDASLKDRSAVGDDLDRLVEVEFVRGK